MTPSDAFALGFWGYLGYVASGLALVLIVLMVIALVIVAKLCWDEWGPKRMTK